MSVVDDLIKEIVSDTGTAGTPGQPDIEKTASAEVSHEKLADELEKIAYSLPDDHEAKLTVEEEILKYAAIHEALTGKNILKRGK